MKTDRRTYRQWARAAATQETRERILQATREALLTRWFDEVTLNEIAAAAEVSVQTVVNHFGGKAGLLVGVVERLSSEIEEVRYRAEPGDVAGAVDAILTDYEEIGDAIWRTLALEDRCPALGPFLASGRAGHRRWVAQTFAPRSTASTTRRFERRVALLVAATDVYTWKLMRRDMGMSRDAVAAAMRELLSSLTRRPDPDPRTLPMTASGSSSRCGRAAAPCRPSSRSSRRSSPAGMTSGPSATRCSRTRSAPAGARLRTLDDGAAPDLARPRSRIFRDWEVAHAAQRLRPDPRRAGDRRPGRPLRGGLPRRARPDPADVAVNSLMLLRRADRRRGRGASVRRAVRERPAAAGLGRPADRARLRRRRAAGSGARATRDGLVTLRRLWNTRAAPFNAAAPRHGLPPAGHALDAVTHAPTASCC